MAFGPIIAPSNIELHDANEAVGRYNFNQPDGGNLVSLTFATSLTEGARYRIEWMQKVEPGDHVEIVGISPPSGHGETGHACVEWIASSGSYGMLFRGHGMNGTGWIDAIIVREIGA